MTQPIPAFFCGRRLDMQNLSLADFGVRSGSSLHTAPADGPARVHVKLDGNCFTLSLHQCFSWYMEVFLVTAIDELEEMIMEELEFRRFPLFPILQLRAVGAYSMGLFLPTTRRSRPILILR
jgi:hypothetical protein